VLCFIISENIITYILSVKSILKNFPKWARLYRGFWKIYLSKIGLIEEPFLLAERNSMKEFLVRNSDKGVLKEFFGQSEYSMVDFSKFNSVVDVGAHIGVFSISAAEETEKVFSYELDPETFSIMGKNIALHEADNVEIFNKGLSGDKETKNISRNSNSLGTSVEIDRGEHSESIEIYSF
jgi:hypothetical protein